MPPPGARTASWMVFAIRAGALLAVTLGLALSPARASAAACLGEQMNARLSQKLAKVEAIHITSASTLAAHESALASYLQLSAKTVAGLDGPECTQAEDELAIPVTVALSIRAQLALVDQVAFAARGTSCASEGRAFSRYVIAKAWVAAFSTGVSSDAVAAAIGRLRLYSARYVVAVPYTLDGAKATAEQVAPQNESATCDKLFALPE
jgi:hypothetical protein